MRICRQYLVEGRVQGVFFRAGTEETASRLGLTGWVRNLRDGRVELIACGDEENLMQLEAWLRRGPTGARVAAVTSSAVTPEEVFDDFRVRF